MIVTLSCGDDDPVKPTVMSCSTSSLSFAYPKATETFEIWNSGSGTLDWTVTGDCSWLDVSPDSGSSTGEHDTVTVTISWSGFSSGETKEDGIQISSNGGDDSVHVVATKAEGPHMCVSPDELTIAYPDAGGVFWVSNCGEDTLYYGLDAPDWASLSPVFGRSRSSWDMIETTVSIDWSQFFPGETKEGTIDYSPIGAVVSLTVNLPAEAPPAYLLEWGTPGSGQGQFAYPLGVAVDAAGDVYVSDMGNHRIVKYTSEGVWITQWGTEGSGDRQFKDPGRIAVDAGGNVYVADAGNNRIQKFDSNGNFILKWGGSGTSDGQFDCPMGIAVDSNNLVYVVDGFNHRVQKFTDTGVFLLEWGTYGTSNGNLGYPEAIEVDVSDRVYVLDEEGAFVQKFTSTGSFIEEWGSRGDGESELTATHGMALDAVGNVILVDFLDHSVKKFSNTGDFLWRGCSDFPSETPSLNGPVNVEVDAIGDLYVADSYNDRIVKFGYR
jgi:DNA-binding beta-propeller fold protein YncE